MLGFGFKQLYVIFKNSLNLITLKKSFHTHPEHMCTQHSKSCKIYLYT